MRKRLVLGIATAVAATLFSGSIQATGLQAWALVIAAVVAGQLLGISEKLDDLIFLFLTLAVTGLITLGNGLGFNLAETTTMVIIGGIITLIATLVIFGLLPEGGYQHWIRSGSTRRLERAFDFAVTVTCYAGLGYLAALAGQADTNNTLMLVALFLLVGAGVYYRIWLGALVLAVPLLGMIGGIALGQQIDISWAPSVLLALSGFCLPIVVALLVYAYMADRNDRRGMDHDDAYYIPT